MHRIQYTNIMWIVMQSILAGPSWHATSTGISRCAVASVTEMGGFLKRGAPQNHPSHETFLVLKPTVTWRSPVLGHQIMSII